ncbi:hypothetical protein WUBG_14020 [Wuchereria bancrofti]|uniref:Uncharacterized protein n=1 Tax=Wuchereria bancrofti TaxID=6293 RepID=J9DZ65_WUCBA|nr:hypothetical protein WUBG_14020 [Wuchereria bancrofti]
MNSIFKKHSHKKQVDIVINTEIFTRKQKGQDGPLRHEEDYSFSNQNPTEGDVNIGSQYVDTIKHLCSGSRGQKKHMLILNSHLLNSFEKNLKKKIAQTDPSLPHYLCPFWHLSSHHPANKHQTA